jgi:transcriptional regulator GlxA family with amidase domain
MKKLRNFGFLLFPDLEELDLVGAWEIINVWRDLYGEPENCLTIAESAGAIRCRKGMRIVAEIDFESCPPLDCLLVPGGEGRRAAARNKKVLEFVRNQAGEAEAILSVCTGTFVLEAAGLIENKKVTTHWSRLEELRQSGNVEVVEERFVRDGKIWTAAGVSAGIDLALAFVADRAGEEIAGKVQLYAEYYPNGKRYGDAHKDPNAPNYLAKGN